MFTFKDKKVKIDIKIVVARHCNTVLNDENKYQGIKYNFPLSKTGMQQANKLRDALSESGYSFDKILVSDTTRAAETGEIATGVESRNFIVDPRLNPFDLGDADAKSEDELFTICRFPVLAKDKENLFTYFGRVREFLREFLVKYNGQTVLLVTHEDITGLIDSYLQNYFLLKAPRNGIKNGNAREYHIYYEGEDYDQDNGYVLKSDDIHFRGPNRWHCDMKEINVNSVNEEDDDEALGC